MKQSLVIGYLYGDLMNIYGDTGNIIALKKRCEWRGIEAEVKNISIGDKIKPGEVDLYFFGGGQDESQIKVAKDLLSSDKKVLKEDLERGIPALAICGGYQLLGVHYKPQNGPKLTGLGILPVYTEGSDTRMIGNICITTAFGDLIGFENHSGKTHLEKGAIPLGIVNKGFGNNGSDKSEGCVYKNVIGCYMHGSLLPKNPRLTDWFIQKALEIKYGKEIALKPIDTNLENKAHLAAIKKFS